jgi:hypothetical protein
MTELARSTARPARKSAKITTAAASLPRVPAKVGSPSALPTFAKMRTDR